jgi:hypothetical protein
MIRDEEQTMAVIIKRDGNEETVRAYNDTGNMAMKVNTDPARYLGCAEMILLSKGRDSLILGRPMARTPSDLVEQVRGEGTHCYRSLKTFRKEDNGQ